MHKYLRGKTNQEIEEYLNGRTVTVARPLAQAEEKMKIKTALTVYNGEGDEAMLRFISPQGWRFIRAADIKSISRK